MKKLYLIKILILSIITALILTYMISPNISRNTSNTIILKDKPIDISSIHDSQGFISIDQKSIYKFDKYIDKIAWLNNEDLLLCYSYPLVSKGTIMEILNTSTNETSSLDLLGSTSSNLISPKGNSFLYNEIIPYKEYSKPSYSNSYNYFVDYSSTSYYSREDKTFIKLPENLSLMEWLPDGSGFIGRLNNFTSLVAYDINTETSKLLLDNYSGLRIDQIVYIKVSKDGSKYYFSYLNSETGLYSIYRMDKNTLKPEKIISDISISGEFELVGNDLILLTNPAKRTIYTYDISKHEKYKDITTNSSTFYVSNDKSVLAYIEYSNNKSKSKISVVSLNDPNYAPTLVFETNSFINSVSWNNHNKLVFLSYDSYSSGSVIYTYSFK